jgi:hypothetical protein
MLRTIQFTKFPDAHDLCRRLQHIAIATCTALILHVKKCGDVQDATLPCLCVVLSFRPSPADSLSPHISARLDQWRTDKRCDGGRLKGCWAIPCGAGWYCHVLEPCFGPPDRVMCCMDLAATLELELQVAQQSRDKIGNIQQWQSRNRVTFGLQFVRGKKEKENEESRLQGWVSLIVWPLGCEVLVLSRWR